VSGDAQVKLASFVRPTKWKSPLRVCGCETDAAVSEKLSNATDVASSELLLFCRQKLIPVSGELRVSE
jgi:hypothetical protein